MTTRKFPPSPLLTALICLALTSAPISAQENEIIAPRVDVIGSQEDLDRIPGSATVIDEETLDSSRVMTTSEALRKVPGLNLRDEEGFGLRPNIGVRGLNPTRSTKVLLLEDGIPLAYAPYGDNASYYHPPIDRFERIEVLKGAGQIMFGPQTAGAVINYITPLPPQGREGGVALTAGSRDYLNAHLRYGQNKVVLDYTHKQGDGARDNMDFELNDLNLKSVLDLGEGQALTLRANYYTEDSQITYSGLTDAEYRNFGARYNPFRNDFFDAERMGISATHEVMFSEDVHLTTNLYGASFGRDWWRQASTTTDTQCNATYPAVTGTFQSDRAAGLAVNPDLCNSIQGRLREYYTWGIEPRLRVNYSAFGIANELDAGVRAHFETQDRRQLNGASPFARTGTLVEDNDRSTDAYSAFAQNRFLLGKWGVTPGVRVEHIENERTNNLNGASGSDSLTEVIPALGATYNPVENVTFFTGVHKGFTPPRTEDVITNNGTSVDVDAEESVNFELGVRATPRQGLNVQATYFRNDFSNQVLVGSIAGGSTNLATGQTLYEGVELSGRLDFAPLFEITPDVYLQAALTWLPTAEITSPFVEVASGNPVPGANEGNRLPYAPKAQATLTVGYIHAEGWDAQLEMVYVSEQFSDFANTAAASVNGNGQIGTIDAYTIFNAAVNYYLKSQRLSLFAAIKNIGDEDYIVDRTRGIQTAMPRLIQVGAKYEF
jgi:Fe(3+) dicitrate transport protein